MVWSEGKQVGPQPLSSTVPVGIKTPVPVPGPLPAMPLARLWESCW